MKIQPLSLNIKNKEDTLEFIEDDELVEITPDSIRLRKKILDDKSRRIANALMEKMTPLIMKNGTQK